LVSIEVDFDVQIVDVTLAEIKNNLGAKRGLLKWAWHLKGWRLSLR